MNAAADVYVLRPPPLGPALGCDALDGSTTSGVIAPLTPADPLAIWREENPLAREPAISPEPGAPPLATWSGWIPDDADPASASIHTWSGRGWDALRSLRDRLGPILDQRGQTILFRPSAAHVLSDPRSCVTFFDQSPRRFGLLLDPVAMLTPPMLPDAGDHLDRILGTLLDRPETRGVVLSDATAEAGAVTHAPLAAGDLPADLLDRLLGRVIASGRPIVLLGDPGPQLGVLRGERAATVTPDPRNP